MAKRQDREARSNRIEPYHAAYDDNTIHAKLAELEGMDKEYRALTLDLCEEAFFKGIFRCILKDPEFVQDKTSEAKRSWDYNYARWKILSCMQQYKDVKEHHGMWEYTAKLGSKTSKEMSSWAR